jgi:hypothetical protein
MDKGITSKRDEDALPPGPMHPSHRKRLTRENKPSLVGGRQTSHVEKWDDARVRVYTVRGSCEAAVAKTRGAMINLDG